MKIGHFNSYMGKKESLLTQVIDSLAFLCGRPKLLNVIPRNIIETLALIQKNKANDCDFLFLTEILPQDQEKVDIIIETWGYRQGIRHTSGSKTPLCSILASKYPGKIVSVDKNMVKQGRGCGALHCEKYNIAIYGFHFPIRKKARRMMREAIIPKIKAQLTHDPFVILMGDFNQTLDETQQFCQQQGLLIRGSTKKTHKICGIGITARNLDNILILTSGGSKKPFHSRDYHVYRGRSDHALLILDIQDEPVKEIK